MKDMPEHDYRDEVDAGPITGGFGAPYGVPPPSPLWVPSPSRVPTGKAGVPVGVAKGQIPISSGIGEGVTPPVGVPTPPYLADIPIPGLPSVPARPVPSADDFDISGIPPEGALGSASPISAMAEVASLVPAAAGGTVDAIAMAEEAVAEAAGDAKLVNMFQLLMDNPEVLSIPFIRALWTVRLKAFERGWTVRKAGPTTDPTPGKPVKPVATRPHSVRVAERMAFIKGVQAPARATPSVAGRGGFGGLHIRSIAQGMVQKAGRRKLVPGGQLP